MQVLYTQFAVLNTPKWNVNNKDKKIIYYIKAVITKYALIELVFFTFHGFFFYNKLKKKKNLSVHGARGDHRLIKLGMR